MREVPGSTPGQAQIAFFKEIIKIIVIITFLAKIAALFSDAVRQRYQESQKISFLKIVFSKWKVCMGKFQVIRREDKNDFFAERLVLSFVSRAE